MQRPLLQSALGRATQLPPASVFDLLAGRGTAEGATAPEKGALRQ